MERLCFLIELNEGEAERYDRVHQEMFPAMHEALVEAGYTNYTIFRHKTTVAGYAECEPDVEAVLAKMAANPVSKLWGEKLAGVAKRGLVRAEEVWRL